MSPARVEIEWLVCETLLIYFKFLQDSYFRQNKNSEQVFLIKGHLNNETVYTKWQKTINKQKKTKLTSWFAQKQE